MLNNTEVAFRGMHVSPAKHSYEESVTTGQTDTHIHTNRQTDMHTPDKVIPMFRYASQAT